MWKVDYYAVCDKCGSVIWMDGSNKKAASKSASSLGWSVSATKVICPDCRPDDPPVIIGDGKWRKTTLERR